MLAYRETGYYQELDEDAFEAGAEVAKVIGIPEAYEISCALDPKLSTLLVTVQETPELAEKAAMADMRGGYGQILTMGAGCVRHFLQQKVAA